MLELEIERHVVDAGRAVANLGIGNLEIVGQFHGGALHRVAEPDLLDGRVFLRNGPGVDGHRVDVLQHHRLGGDFQHVLADRPQMRHGAQAAHDAADPEGVGNGLAQVVLFGHLEIDHGRGLVAADLEADDDEVGAIERFALVRESLHGGRNAEGVHQLARNDGALFEALRVDVHQADFSAGQCLALQDIADDVLHEHGRAGADEGDLGVGHWGCLRK